ncbi:MAG TPA: phosphoribosyltransferase [Gemmatimonadaceae bacterium]|nr:phosphoribosyltransferase [Gemmatimonadaceae bacterium]
MSGDQASLPFRDRYDAGRQLAARLSAYALRPEVFVLALPRGGVPVGFEVAATLGAPLDIFVVRKLGVPDHEELAMGAIASGGVRVLDRQVIAMANVSEADVQRITATEEQELARRERRYRGDRPFPDLRGKTAILVDDGLATGSTMRAAVAALRQEGPSRVIVAVPVAAPDVRDSFHGVADEIVCAATPIPFHAVGLWYDDFTQTTDDEVRDLIERAQRRQHAGV